MTFEEIEIVDAPTDAEFWGGVAGGVLIGVAVGLLIVS
ncbi:daptide-type RiPP [Alteromonas sp. KUL17]|nr:daptide-type RiPP [Alteromonas sp. KUL17]